MRGAVLEAVSGADVLLMAAAVSDFRPARVAEHKIKKEQDEAGGMTLAQERNPDILAAVREQKERSGFPRVTAGFAAETTSVLEHGRGKLRRKGLDLIAINDVSADDAGFAVDTNRIVVLKASGDTDRWPLLAKSAVADRLIETVAELLIEKETQTG
jgi:phosphopantothenoylcysteine decarboxylase/phosphopantothenate--cysteine ligase